MSIIAINGRLKSGKDTITSIIQKETIAGWENKKFAAKLKQICGLLIGAKAEDFESQEFKDKELSPEWVGIDGKILTGRKLLQIAGTEAMRSQLCTNVWVNALFADYLPGSNWIISDLRFPNEYDAVKKLGGITIRVRRPETEVADAHVSETALDNHVFDYEILNDKSILALENEVLFNLIKEGLV